LIQVIKRDHLIETQEFATDLSWIPLDALSHELPYRGIFYFSQFVTEASQSTI
jgi:hypothetical protein